MLWRLYFPALAALLTSACGPEGALRSPSTSDARFAYTSETKSGVATYYDADGSGNCSYDKSSDLDVVALNFPEYAGSAACGACLRVQGPKGEVTVRVVDSCPGCREHHLDLSESAFAKVAELRAGRVSITYQTVACEVAGNVRYRYKEGTSKWWTAIQVQNHRVPVATLEYRRSGAYVEMKRQSYNYFVEPKGVGDLPSSGLAVRLTAADGQVFEDEIRGGFGDGRVVGGAAQFE